MNPKYNLEERLIDFTCLIFEISDNIQNTKAGNHISGQMIRSGSSPALNYGEAQNSESKNDFIHKFKIILKELRETLIGLKITKKGRLCKNNDLLEKGIAECIELISIFVKSIDTASKNTNKK
ncbi:MAG: four helix bundle protein [Bacteroidia bacterium]|nr:four helix bundle protein [Bacteroidia bacterium]